MVFLELSLKMNTIKTRPRTLKSKIVQLPHLTSMDLSVFNADQLILFSVCLLSFALLVPPTPFTMRPTSTAAVEKI